ncbi:RsbR, positive regulator of sigma-B [Minicystis rosea]|nr:RsbR, positive regulator of sigma-B [Minicystis rosea]
MTQMLERMPGVAFCSRMDPATGVRKWVYINARAAEFYDVPEEQLRADPNVVVERVLPEDRARMQAAVAQCVQNGAPLSIAIRMRRRDGSIRWIETHANVEREPDGMLLWYGQVLDVTERKDLEKSLADSEMARERADSLYGQVLDALPLAVSVLTPTGEFLVMNPANRRLLTGFSHEQTDGTPGAYRSYLADGVTPVAPDDNGMVYALRGETTEEEIVLRNPNLDGDVRLRVVWTPLRDDDGKVYAALSTSQDITRQRALENELRARNEELGASEASKAELIERLRYSIDELSNPILQVWDDVLAMPIIGVVDSRRTADMVQRLLGEVARTQASFVIIDLTGVEIVDTKTADHLMKLMRKVEIVGARCVLTGIRPAVAETLVDIGVDFGNLRTLRNLKFGLREALRSGRRESARDLDFEELSGEGEKTRAHLSKR